MTSSGQMDVTSRVLDVTARSLDLLAIVVRISSGADGGSQAAKELGRWLGREDLNEVELKHFLESTQALAWPNRQPRVVNFFGAITDTKPKQSVVLPFWAQPSGALGRLIASDPVQRWLTATVCSLFRYHDESFIKRTLSYFILLASRPGKPPLSEIQLVRHPEMLRLDPVVSKIVHSSWVNIANTGIIGSDSECPQLPAELSWACKRGHNIGSHKLAVILNRLRDPPKEVIFQSERLLTNLVLWLTWHWDGRLRVVASGSIVYDKTLGPADHTVECRVGTFCPKGEDERSCAKSIKDPVPFFEMLERVEGSLKSLFSGQYDKQQTLMSEPLVRQRLYKSPFRYERDVQRSLEVQTKRTGQELLRWFCGLPIEKDNTGSSLGFRVLLESSLAWRGLRVADLLGRTPALLNASCGELGRPFVIFSPPRQPTPPTVDNFMDSEDEDSDMWDDDEDNDEDVDFEDQPRVLIEYFPILYDLVEHGRLACKCFECSKQKGKWLLRDENCLGHKVFMEAMFYFSHGIADAFGAPDASGRRDALLGDSGGMAILFDIVYSIRSDPSKLEGRVDWHTLLNTTSQIFLGCPALETMTDATEKSVIEAAGPLPQNRGGVTIVAVQHGDLAVLAPWLDLSQRLDLHRCFRWEVIQGRLQVPVNEVSGREFLQAVARETTVIETQDTEDVSDYAELVTMPSHPSGASIQLKEDRSEETCDFILVSSGEKYKLLMRVTSEAHSRMVDPSNAIIKMARGTHPIQCSHGADRIGTVPEGHHVQLYRFDEVLGRWGAEQAAGHDPEQRDGSSLAKEMQSQPSPAKSRVDSEDHVPLRITHVLNSQFKFNTALALCGDESIFVGGGHVCLNCVLDGAISFKPADLHEDPNDHRWVIIRGAQPSNKVPQSQFHLKASEARLITST